MSGDVVLTNRLSNAVHDVTFTTTITHSHITRKPLRASSEQVYGPTETTVTSTFHRVLPEEWAHIERTGCPIGKPIHNMAALILDETLRLVPEGKGNVGSLFLCGAGMSRGYIGLPEKTAKAFVHNPFPELVQKFRALGFPRPELLYDTGDLAERWVAGGPLMFHGRRDNQVKIRGERIELGEVESVLMGCSRISVRQAVVLARKDVPLFAPEPVLVAYVEAEEFDGSLGTGEQVRQAVLSFAREQMPDYQVPSFVVPMAPDAWRTTAANKVDAKALPLPEPTATAAVVVDDESKSTVIHVNNNNEGATSPGSLATIIRVASAVSGQAFTADSSLVALGIDSINAIVFCKQVEAHVGIKINGCQLADYPTARSLAVYIDSRTDRPRAAGDCGFEHDKTDPQRQAEGKGEIIRNLVRGMAPLDGLRGAIILTGFYCHNAGVFRLGPHQYQANRTRAWGWTESGHRLLGVEGFMVLIGLVTVIQTHFRSSGSRHSGQQRRDHGCGTCAGCGGFWHGAATFWKNQFLKLVPVLYLQYVIHYIIDAASGTPPAGFPADPVSDVFLRNQTNMPAFDEDQAIRGAWWTIICLLGLQGYLRQIWFDTNWFVASMMTFFLLFPFTGPIVRRARAWTAIITGLGVFTAGAIAGFHANYVDATNRPPNAQLPPSNPPILNTSTTTVTAWWPYRFPLADLPLYFLGAFLGQALLATYSVLDPPHNQEHGGTKKEPKKRERKQSCRRICLGSSSATEDTRCCRLMARCRHTCSSQLVWGIVADLCALALVLLAWGPPFDYDIDNPQARHPSTKDPVHNLENVWFFGVWLLVLTIFIFALCNGKGVACFVLARNPLVFYGRIIWPLYLLHTHTWSQKLLTGSGEHAAAWPFNLGTWQLATCCAQKGTCFPVRHNCF